MQSPLGVSKRLWTIVAGWIAGRVCPACGTRSLLIRQPALWPALIAEWGLSAEWVRHFDEREGTICGYCQSNLRARHLALGLLEAGRLMAGAEAGSLKELCQHSGFRQRAIAEINAAGNLHRFLKMLPRLAYSEFGSKVPGVPSEDLLALSYADNSFDLAITSETLEHVPDIQKALQEICRILKPGGWHVFTVPVVWDRPKTRIRASLNDHKLTHHLPPSHHGSAKAAVSDLLVFYEFGSDFMEMCAAAGFEVRLLKDPDNPALVTFLAQKPQG